MLQTAANLQRRTAVSAGAESTAEGIRDMPPDGVKRHDEKAGHVAGKSRSIAIFTAGVDRS